MRGGGAGRGGGRGIMRRAFGRTLGSGVKGPVQDGARTRSPPPPSSTSATTTTKSLNNILSLSTTSSANNPVSATLLPGWNQYSSNVNNSFYDSDAWEWETVEDDALEEEEEGGYVFGSVPSMDEVEGAVSSLRHFLASASYSQLKEDGYSSSLDKDLEKQTPSPSDSTHTVSSYQSGLDWIEPSLYVNDQRMHQSEGYGRSRVYEAFHLLQKEASIQRAVLSISTDKAVWEAIMNNDAIRELKDAYGAENKNVVGPDESPAAGSILSWILVGSKAKFMELMDKVSKLLTEVFRPAEMEKDTTEGFQEKLKSSLLLSIVVLLIVVVTRASRV